MLFLIDTFKPQLIKVKENIYLTLILLWRRQGEKRHVLQQRRHHITSFSNRLTLTDKLRFIFNFLTLHITKKCDAITKKICTLKILKRKILIV